MSKTLYQIMSNYIGIDDDQYSVIYDGISNCCVLTVDIDDIDDCLKYVGHKMIKTNDLPACAYDVYINGSDEAHDEDCLAITCIETDCNGNQFEILLYLPYSWH